MILNETVMGVAIPRLMASLSVTASAAQWLTTAFLITMAVVIPVTGFLMQRLNTRPVFLVAMAFFDTGTLICAVAPGLEVLIVGRVVQAMGTAIMFPLLMTTIMTLVPEQMRGRVMGNVSIVISVAPALGPTISGLILNALEWRFLFIVVLPIALGATALGALRLVNVAHLRKVPLDVVSVPLSALAFGGLVYGLSSFGSGRVNWVGIGTLLSGVIAMAILVLRQIRLSREDKALLDFGVFRSGNFARAQGMMLISMATLFGAIILLPIYLQNVLKASTLTTGLLFLPGGLVMGLMAPSVGRLYDRFGTRPLIVPGAFLVSSVLWALTRIGTGTSLAAILIGHVVISVGFGLLFTPLFTAALSSVPAHRYGHASAIAGAFQQLAGAAGVALFIAIMSANASSLQAAGVSPAEALTHGIRSAFLLGAVLSLVFVLLSFFVRKPASPDAPPTH